MIEILTPSSSMKNPFPFFLFYLLGLLPFFPSFAQVDTQSNKSTIMLNHIALHVQDLKESGKFYSEVLQLKEIPEPFKDGLHLWYSIGQNSQLHLIQRDEKMIVPGKTTHLCFSVLSIEAFIANLDQFKVEYGNWLGDAKAPTVRVDGIKQIYFQDPNGYWIEVNNDFR